MRGYHGVLQKLGIKPHRSLEEDMKLQTGVMSYGGNGVAMSLPPGAGSNGRPKAKTAVAVPSISNGQPDFTKMTAAQKIAYHKARWDRILG